MRTMLALLGTSQTSALHRVHNNRSVPFSRRDAIEYIDVGLWANQSLTHCRQYC